MRVKSKRETIITIMSIWQKDDKICRIQSTQEGKEIPVFVFRGHNPFPCFNMKSTFTIINKWMTENGWERKPGGYKVVTIDKIDPETGEILWHSSTRETYIPVEKPDCEFCLKEFGFPICRECKKERK